MCRSSETLSLLWNRILKKTKKHVHKSPLVLIMESELKQTLTRHNYLLHTLAHICENIPFCRLRNQFLPLCNQVFRQFPSHFMFPKRVHSFPHSGFLQKNYKMETWTQFKKIKFIKRCQLKWSLFCFVVKSKKMTLALIMFEVSGVYQDYICDYACNSGTQVIVPFVISCTSLG